MKRVISLLVTSLLLCLLFPTSAPAATVSGKKVLVFFQNYLSNAEYQYKSESTKVKQQFDEAVSVKEKAIRQAKQDFLRSNQVRILKLGENRNYWGNFNCPPTRPDCIYVDKGPKFEIGEITSIKEVVSSRSDYLNEIDLIVNLGLIELLNPKEYQLASRIIREETAAIATLQSKNKVDMAMIEDRFNEANKAQPAILAIKRALKNSSNFQDAFVTALKFEYNKDKLDELASLPFRYINSLKALDSAIKVTRISEEADGVAANYSYSAAKKINVICGKTFTSEPEFKDTFDHIAIVYRNATGQKLRM